MNYDGSTLLEIEVDEGQTVVYALETPTKPSESTYWAYNFTGWDHDLTNVTESFTTTAQYEVDYQGKTSIYDIVQARQENTTVTTWGTVSGIYSYNNTNSFYLQSTDASHKTAGILVYNYLSSADGAVKQGDRITVTGTSTIYNGLPELTSVSTYTIDGNDGKDAITPYEPDISFWKNLTDISSENYATAKALGTFKVKITGRLSYTETATTGYICFDDSDDTKAEIYIKPTTSTASLKELALAYSDKNVTVTGYISPYEKDGNGKINIHVISPDDLTCNTPDVDSTISLVLDKDDFSSMEITGYTTGNSVSATVNSKYNFQFYRAYYSNSLKLFDVSAYDTSYLGGSIQNTTAFNKISEISLTYSSQKGGSLTYGKNSCYSSEKQISASSASTTQKFEFSAAEDISFFSITTNGSDISIESLEIKYDSSASSANTIQRHSSGQDRYRIEPSVFSGTLVAGESYVDVPQEIQITGTTYSVISSKRYTYYTYDYVSSHTDCLEDSVMVDPEDVSAYCIAFSTYPANYGSTSDYRTVSNLYGSDTRRYSVDYTWSTGYAQHVPYRTHQ
ncbi:MAG: hypothetical protein WCR67_06530, partial [Bacilli bacterium]